MRRATSLLRTDARAVFALAALLGLLQPLLAPVVPDLAGWSPAHSHIYRTGAAVDHTHPWDTAAPEPAPQTALCVLHSAPHEQPSSAASTPASAAADPTDSDAPTSFAAETSADVAFTTDGPAGVGAIALASSAGAPACPAPVAASIGAPDLAPPSFVLAPRPEPPRA